MNKKTVINFFGNAPRMAKRLGYAHRNCIYNMPDPLPPRTVENIITRMKAKRIKIPIGWTD